MTHPRIGFGQRIALLFGVLALLLVVLGVVVSTQVADMRMQVRRVIEEHRESSFTRDMTHALRMLDTQLETSDEAPFDAARLALLHEHLSVAANALVELRRGPTGDDPSSDEHTREEFGLFDSLAAQIADIERGLSGPRHALRAAVGAALAQALELHEEVRDEALESSRDLQHRGRDLRNVVLWTSALALAGLCVALWMVWRFVVRPVEALRAGVARLARGERDARVEPSSRDEIGELATEFNRMSAELAGVHTELERRVEQRTQEFVRAARLAGLGTLAAGVAHEINNPLASIASCAEGLERKLRRGVLTPEEQAEYLQIIASEAYRAHGITSRLLELARTEDAPPREFAARDLVRDLDVLLEHRLAAKRLSLDASCDADISLRGHPNECKQVLLNLVHNAIDASPTGGRIRVACNRSGGEALLEVEDHGPGIPRDQLGRIFDPFFTTKEPGQGTGLGLAIAHRIVTGHGGRIEVVDTGHGALFRVHLPLAA